MSAGLALRTLAPLTTQAPTGFFPAEDVTSAWFAPAPQRHGVRERKTGAQKAGLAYEKLALEELVLRFPTQDLKLRKWLGYADKHGKRVCQPDAYIIRGSWVIIFEVKVRHTDRAWWQLRQLYAPVLSVLYPGRSIAVCEMTKSFDSFTAMPEHPAPMFDFDEVRAWVEDPDSAFRVWQWRPRA